LFLLLFFIICSLEISQYVDFLLVRKFRNLAIIFLRGNRDAAVAQAQYYCHSETPTGTIQIFLKSQYPLLTAYKTLIVHIVGENCVNSHLGDFC
jgi:hypothetical protein